MINKCIVKKGDTFSGKVELFENGSSLRPQNVESFQISSTVRNTAGTFFADIILTQTEIGVFLFSVHTGQWPISQLIWDIQIDYNDQSISVPSDSNILIDVRSGVTT